MWTSDRKESTGDGIGWETMTERKKTHLQDANQYCGNFFQTYLNVDAIRYLGNERGWGGGGGSGNIYSPIVSDNSS